MDFKNIRNKAVEAAKGANGQLGNIGKKTVEKVQSNDKLGEIWTKAVDKATEPRTKKQLIVGGAISVATGLAMGGALPLVIVGAAAEGVVTQQVTKRLAARKAKQQEQDNTKPADNAKPADPRKDGPRL